MPEALATSKRKFYKALDSLSAPASTSPSAPNKRPLSSSSKVETARDSSKRVSILSTPAGAASIEPSAKRLRPSTSSTTLNSLRSLHARNASSTSIASTRSKVAIAPKTTAQDDTEKKQTPHFSPWSHDTFLARLKTFAPVSQWHPKPEAINEVAWASRGWECVDTNTVGCQGCNKRLIVRLDPSRRSTTTTADSDTEEDESDKMEQFENALVDKYKSLIIDGHSSSCLWRTAGCKSDVYRLPVVRSAIWQSQLGTRYASLLAIEDSIARANIKGIGTSPDAKTLLQNLPSRVLNTDTESPAATAERALTMALTGWTGMTEAYTDLLVCEACFQRVGLWMYQPDYRRPGHEESDDSENDSLDLDLVEMHREHCPYRNGISQAATGEYAGLPAWKILWDVVGRYADEQRRRSKSRLSFAPSVMDSPSAPVAGAEEEEWEHVQTDTLSREEIQKLDKERTTKLRRLKRMFSIRKKAP